MTCVVGMLKKDGGIIMGADSCGSNGWSKTKRKDPKVFIKGNMIFAFCGSFRMGNILQYKLVIPKHPKKMSPIEYMNTLFIDAVRECLRNNGHSSIDSNEESIGGSFLVGYKRAIYTVESDLQVAMDEENYTAEGSGYLLALGSLSSTENISDEKKRVLMALQSAAKYDVGVSAPFRILELKKS